MAKKLNLLAFLRHPPLVLIFGFFVLIVVGGLLLKFAGFTKTPIGWLEAFFMTTSAITVTGLSVVDLSQFNLSGQILMMVLIEVGGLGFMTFTVLALMVLQRRMSMSGQLIASQAMGGVKLSEINATTRQVIRLTLIVQSLGWVLLFLQWQGEMGMQKAAYHALFYTISAFNNAGFALTGSNLMPYAYQTGVILTISVLIIFGGLGFFVITDFFKSPLAKQLNVNTKIILTATISLNLIAFVIIWILEHNNPLTIGQMPWPQQLANTWFAAITPRTAGFNTIATEYFTDASTFLTLVLMFIGAGSFSTGGGIKVGTMVVLILITRTYMHQRDSVTVMRRKIPERIVKKSVAVVIVTGLLIMLSIFLLLVLETHHDFIDVLFEVVSAISTVGLSRGITTLLTPAGETVLMFMMFAGRVGPLTIGYLIALPKKTKIEYPEVQLEVG